jgi:hypothetical protein
VVRNSTPKNSLADFPERIEGEGVDYGRARLTISVAERATEDRSFHEEAYFATAEKGSVMIEAVATWTTTQLRTFMSETP